ncbi:hypothetical protein D3C76_736650 [compost metagenome]
MHSPKARIMVFDGDSFCAWSVNIPVHYWIPASGQVIGELVAGVGISKRQTTSHDQRVVVPVFPQAVDDLGHHLQDATGTLEVIEARPVVIQPVKYLRMNRVSLLQTFEVMAFLSFGRKFPTVSNVEVCELTTHLLSSQLVVDPTEQTTPNDLKSLLSRHRLPQRLHTAEVMRKRLQSAHTALATRFFFGLWQRGQHYRCGHSFKRLGQRLDEGQVGVKGSAGQ